MRCNFKMHALSAAVASTLFSIQAYSQSESDAATFNEEEVVVTGIRQAVERAVDAKRMAETVSDSIFAEDVGKSTDQNIADALSRVTGVSVQEDSGEGARITVRGASPSENVISLNGMELTGGLSGPGENATSDNSVDLSAYSADILSAIDVVKTAAADQNEGSLGANIELRTARPLLIPERRSLTAEGRHNEYRGSNDYRISGSFADKFLDDSLGVIFTLTADKNATREDRIQNNWEEGTYSIFDADASGAVRTAKDIYGNVIRVGQDDFDSSSEINISGSDISYDDDSGANPHYAVLGKQGTLLSTSTTDRDRVTGNLGVQFQPFDGTDIQLDLTHTKQTVENQYLSMNLGYGGENPQLSDKANANNEIDYVTEWTAVDVANRTLVSSAGRSHQGGTNQFESERDLTTNVATLRLEQYLTDNLTMNVMAGYSQTEDELINGIGVSTATWGTVRPEDLPANSGEIEPVGYSCEGARCAYQVGSSYANFDPVYGQVTDVTTLYNPHDLMANHMGNVTWRTNTQTDTNQVLNLDFDWDIDRFNVASVEFGAKYASRERDVQSQNETLTTGTVLIDRNDPNTSYSTNGMQNIRLAQMISPDRFPYDDFLDGLEVEGSEAISNGWSMIDIDKALRLLSGQDPNSVGRQLLDGGSRTISTDTSAAYFKANFEFLDGRVTANAGLRYVRDENEAVGYGSATLTRPNWLYDAQDLMVDRQLANTGLAPCPVDSDGLGWEYTDSDGNPVGSPDDTDENGTAYFLYDPANKDDYNNCYDWRLTHAYVAGDPDTYPVNPDGSWRFTDNSGNPVYEVNRIFAMDYSGTVPSVIQNEGLPEQIVDPMQWSWTDWSSDPSSLPMVNTNTARFRHFNTSGLTYGYIDHSTSFTGPLGNDPIAQNRAAIVTDKATQHTLLPSMTVNFQINDEMILRGAVSRTMTRPQTDYLNPRLSISENVWDPQDTGTKGNTHLKPLTSDNFDLSYEWYFGDSNMLSVGYFHKDMENRPTEIQSFYHYENFRRDYYREDLNVLLPYDSTATPLTSDCAVERSIGNFGVDDRGWSLNCRDLLMTEYVNFNEQKLDGLELGYTQMYDSLPGLLAYTGLQANYTYQYSKSAEQETADGRVIDSLPVAWTPQHTANLTLFWENDKLQLRLANRYTGVQMTELHATGAIWKDATNRLDFSASYDINDMFTVTFNALNLLDETHRTFLTMSDARAGFDEEGNPVFLSEGWGYSSDTYSDRTVSSWKNGRQFRVGIRANF